MTTLLRKIATLIITLAMASSYAEPVPLIIQTGPGGLNHKYALELEPVLSKILKETVIIEFRPGGQGLVGAQALASNKSPSLTLMLGAAQQEFAIDQLRDIVPVLDLGIAPTVIIAKPGLGITSLSQLSRAKGNYTIGIPNGAAQLYWVKEFVKNHKNLTLVEVPYKSGAAVLTDIAGGHVDLGIASAIGAAPLIQDGKVVALATLSTKRSSLIPAVGTPRDQGIQYTGDSIGFSHMFVWANPGAPAETIQNLKTGFQSWANSAEGQEMFRKIDLGVNLPNVARPEIVLREQFKK